MKTSTRSERGSTKTNTSNGNETVFGTHYLFNDEEKEDSDVTLHKQIAVKCNKCDFTQEFEHLHSFAEARYEVSKMGWYVTPGDNSFGVAVGADKIDYCPGCKEDYGYGEDD